MLTDEEIDDLYRLTPDRFAFARAIAEKAAQAQREADAQYLRDAAARLIPDGKRVNQVDRHVSHVLACKGDEIAEGAAIRKRGEPT